MQSNLSIAVIGAGNMGSCLIGGLVKNGHPSSKIWASDADAQKLAALEQQFKINTSIDNKQAAAQADVIIFAVKPQIFVQVAENLAQIIAKQQPLVISIAAGVRIENMETWLGSSTAIVRAMPNTPALIGKGVTALFANPQVKSQQNEVVETIMQALGLVVWLQEEKQMDAVTALSGSGPAYFFLMMDALQKSAESLGLPAETAKTLTLQTALGAAQMALESDKSLDELKRIVTSPGGTTEKGLSVLEDHNVREILHKTLVAAKSRSEELAGLMKK